MAGVREAFLADQDGQAAHDSPRPPHRPGGAGAGKFHQMHQRAWPGSDRKRLLLGDRHRLAHAHVVDFGGD